MRLLRYILLTLTIAIGMPVMADDYKFLSISQTDNVATVEVDNIDKITFDTADMVLHLSNGTEQRFPLANLSKMSSPTTLQVSSPWSILVPVSTTTVMCFVST